MSTSLYSHAVIGEQVGSYRITGELGRGGMGTVYAAEHVLIGRLAAVKMLLPQLSQNQQIVQRFFNEAKAATAIRHPGIVEITWQGQRIEWKISNYQHVSTGEIKGRTVYVFKVAVEPIDLGPRPVMTVTDFETGAYRSLKTGQVTPGVAFRVMVSPKK